jgi:hypothetical protein
MNIMTSVELSTPPDVSPIVSVVEAYTNLVAVNKRVE